MPICLSVRRTTSLSPAGGRFAVALLAVTALLSARSARGETWTIPGTVNAGGLNNTRFVSDVALTNPGALPASVTLSFLGPGGLPPRTINLPAGSTTAYRNLLDSLWGAQGAGATQVTSTAPLLNTGPHLQHRRLRHLRRRAAGLRRRPDPRGGEGRR